MVFHGHGNAHEPITSDPIRALESAVYNARAASHEQRFDTAIASAFRAQGDVNSAVVDLMRSMAGRIAVLEAQEAARVRIDP